MSLTTLNHAPIDIVLSETDTIWLLDKIGTVVNNECEDIKIVEANNEIYNNVRTRGVTKGVTKGVVISVDDTRFVL